MADIEIIPIDKINVAFTNVDKREVDFRYVIDMSTQGLNGSFEFFQP